MEQCIPETDGAFAINILVEAMPQTLFLKFRRTTEKIKIRGNTKTGRMTINTIKGIANKLMYVTSYDKQRIILRKSK